MIKSLHIDNFKSLVDFKLDNLTGFTCLIGLNGAGKTTLLQAFDFLSQLMSGDITGWLKGRGWNAEDLASKWLYKEEISFSITTIDTELNEFTWSGSYNIKQMRCDTEYIVQHNSKRAVFYQSGNVFGMNSDTNHFTSMPTEKEENPILFKFQGSLLSQLELQSYPALEAIKTEIQNLNSLDLLSPERMRKPSKSASDIGKSGEQLAAFIHELTKENHNVLLEKMRQFYPNIVQLFASVDALGDFRLMHTEYNSSPTLENKTAIVTEANHINDGFLRVLAMVAETFTGHSTILYDEIENGINPEIIEQLVDFLVAIEQQIIVTTHSPMILNYLEDEVAKESVVLLYKNKFGHTKARRFFDHPETARKLKLLGAGEVFVDTSLSTLAEMFQEEV